MKYKLKEHDDHFMVDQGDGKPFKVTKKGLGKATEDKIRKMADGGEVGGGAGVGVENIAPTEPPAPGGASGSWERPVAVGPLPPQNADEWKSYIQANPDLVRAPAAPTAPKAVGTPGGGIFAAMSQSDKEWKVAAQKHGDELMQEASDLGSAYKDALAKSQTMDVAAKAKHDANEARIQAQNEKVASGEIDPERYWKTRNTGQKISAAIGLFLGGIGSGLTHGPNIAFQIIDRAIDHDIDAQKTNLGKEQSLLRDYMQQGLSEDQASRMAKAEMWDVANAQAKQISLTHAGPKQQTEIAMQLADRGRATAMDRLKVSGELLGQQHAALGMEGLKQQIAMNKLQFDNLQSAMNKVGGGQQLSPAEMMALPKQLREMYAPKASEEELKEQIQQTPKLGFGEALAAKIPGSATSHRVETWAGDTAGAILRASGYKGRAPQEVRDALMKELTGVASLRSDIRTQAMNSIAEKYGKLRLARQTGFSAPSQPETEQ